MKMAADDEADGPRALYITTQATADRGMMRLGCWRDAPKWGFCFGNKEVVAKLLVEDE